MDLADRADTADNAEGTDPGHGFLRCFGRQMKLLREAAGLAQAELIARVGYGEAQIASVEQGRRIPKPELVDAVDRVVGGGGVLSAMKGEVEKARHPGFFREFVRLEAGPPNCMPTTPCWSTACSSARTTRGRSSRCGGRCSTR